MVYNDLNISRILNHEADTMVLLSGFINLRSLKRVILNIFQREDTFARSVERRSLPQLCPCLGESRLPVGFAILLILELLNIVNESLFNGHSRFKISRRDTQQTSCTHAALRGSPTCRRFPLTIAVKTLRLTQINRLYRDKGEI